MKTYGKTERAIIAQCIAERSPFPDFIKNAPELEPGLDIYYSAFWALAGDANMNGLIPWTAIRQYAEWFKFDSDQAEVLFAAVSAMNQIWLENEGGES